MTEHRRAAPEGTSGWRSAAFRPRWLWAAAAGTLLLVAFAGVHAAGGTHTAWPHLYYFAIIVAALPFGWRGGVLVGLAAAVLCGPLTPLDTVEGTAQSVANWTTRGAFFVSIGALAGLATTALRRTLVHDLSEQVRHEFVLARSATTPQVTPDVATGRRVRQVITERTFHPVFQPIYSLRDGRLLAVEALTRFDTDPLRTPDVWFHDAATVGMSVELDLATIEAALVAAQHLPAGVALHLNVSPPTLHHHELLTIAATSDHPLVIEVTEHAVIEDYARLARARDKLREHDVKLAVDDTGAGFASLQHVVRLAPDVLKIDRSLVHGMRHDPVREAMAQALIGFARDTGSTLIAEGIEDHADLTAWQRLGADAAQGYLLGRPGPLPVEPVCAHVPRSFADRVRLVTG